MSRYCINYANASIYRHRKKPELTVDQLMIGNVKPELIIGVEFGISNTYACTVPEK